MHERKGYNEPPMPLRFSCRFIPGLRVNPSRGEPAHRPSLRLVEGPRGQRATLGLP
jgi:hypothetical protein